MDRVTKPQKKMLVSLLKETKYMEGKKEKEWYWEKIQAALNSIGPKKTIIQWKKCWRDMRLTTRKKLAEIKRCQGAGGTSPPPGLELTQEDNDIIDIVGSEYFYEEMGTEVKAEHFLSGFEYVPEQFCDAILSAASKEASAAQEGHGADTEGQPRPVAGTSQEQNHTIPPYASTSAAVSQSESVGGSAHQPQMLHTVGLGQSPSSAIKKKDPPTPIVFSSRSEAAFEDKLLKLLQDNFCIRRERKRQSLDPDRMFLLSMFDELKKIPEECKLDAKSDLIQVLKKWQRQCTDNGSHLPHAQQQQLPHNVYHLQKKFDKSLDSKEGIHTQEAHQHAQQLSHGMYQLQKKYDESGDKVHQQQPDRKQHDSHQQQQQQQQPPPPSSAMHHPQQIPHSIMFPIPPQLRTDQHHPHSHPQHAQQQQQQQQQPQQQHHSHPPPIFVSSPATMPDRTMTYDNVG